MTIKEVFLAWIHLTKDYLFLESHPVTQSVFQTFDSVL